MLAISPKLTITSNAQVAREAAFFQMRNSPVEHDPFGISTLVRKKSLGGG